MALLNYNFAPIPTLKNNSLLGHNDAFHSFLVYSYLHVMNFPSNPPGNQFKNVECIYKEIKF